MEIIHDPITDAAKRLFGLDYLFPYQRLVVGNIMEAASPSEDDGDAGGDRETLGRQIVILPTGAGKSLCFQLPAMLLNGPTLVIYPILSLMADQERRLGENNFSPVTLRGGQSSAERDAIWQKLKTGKSRFIIANPEVLLTEKVLSELALLEVAHIVIDEAHCVSEWGESFRPSYLEIYKIIEAAKAPIITAFTATASASVLEKIEKYIFGARGAHRIIDNPDRSNISYAATGCIARDVAVRDLLITNEKPAIVFCSSRVGTERLARYLRINTENKEVRFYHAGLEREEKTDVEKWFFSSNDGILVATCAYGMGVDKANIRTVIHRDCPPSVEAYLQESGRAGRDGKFSRAFLLWGPDDDAAVLRAKTESDKKRLNELFEFARDYEHCRRRNLIRLLNYEGEISMPETECCDVCAGRASVTLREDDPFYRYFQKNKRVGTLKESRAVLSDGETSDWVKSDIKTVLDYYLNTGFLFKHRRFPWKDKLSIREKQR